MEAILQELDEWKAMLGMNDEISSDIHAEVEEFYAGNPTLEERIAAINASVARIQELVNQISQVKVDQADDDQGVNDYARTLAALTAEYQEILSNPPSMRKADRIAAMGPGKGREEPRLERLANLREKIRKTQSEYNRARAARVVGRVQFRGSRSVIGLANLETLYQE